MSEPLEKQGQARAHAERVADEGASLADQAVLFPLLAGDVVFAGKVWDVRRDLFQYDGASLAREYVDHPGSVAVVALDGQDRMALIRQYRHPVRRREWEIPAGLLDVTGEDPLAAAQRELAEEADLLAAQWSVLAEFASSPGGSNEAVRIYLARQLTVSEARFRRTAEEADIELRWVALDQVVGAVLARTVQAPTLVVGALAAQAARNSGWQDLGPADEPWHRHPQPAPVRP